MNQIIEVNEYNMLVEIKLKKYRIYGTMTLTKIHKMNVILRKKETHSYLNQFLHGS